jgi:truncated hemoglobin YjbI
MGNKPFMQPVFLRLQQDRTESYQARNVSEAMEYLKHFWSGPRTGEYRRAKAICRSALDNLVSAESARNYLIAAAERAGILDRGPRGAAGLHLAS